jgi:inorganic pyrophosphatase
MDLSKLPAFSTSETVNCIVEIPAGTNTKIEYDKLKKKFVPDLRNGQNRIITYLPYPANYGFIASTYSDPKKGGDGDALDVLILCESLPTGTVIEAKPIAVLRLIDNKEEDLKLICIPSEKKKRTMDAATFAEFSEKFPQALDLIEIWFRNYDPHDNTRIDGWGDEKEALSAIINSLHATQ